MQLANPEGSVIINTPAVLEMRIHLENGQVAKYVQDDPMIAQEILETLHPNHLFSAPRPLTAPQLLIGSDHILTAFQPRLVVRVDLITELVPSWSASAVALNTREITEEEFDARYQPNRDVQRLPSQEIVVFGVWEMVNGARIFLQTHLTGLEETRLPQEVGLLIHQVMTSGGMLARGRKTGYVVLNPARMLHYTSYVGLQEMPANVLPMRQLLDPSTGSRTLPIDRAQYLLNG